MNLDLLWMEVRKKLTNERPPCCSMRVLITRTCMCNVPGRSDTENRCARGLSLKLLHIRERAEVSPPLLRPLPAVPAAVIDRVRRLN